MKDKSKKPTNNIHEGASNSTGKGKIDNKLTGSILYKRLLNQIQAMVFVYSLDEFKLIDANDKFLKYFSVNKDFISIQEIFSKSFSDKIISTKSSTLFTFQYKKNVHFSVNIQIFGEPGQTTGMVILRDVSRQLQTEKAIRVTEEKLQSIFLNIHQPFAILSKDYKILAINKMANVHLLKIFGFNLQPDSDISHKIKKGVFRPIKKYLDKTFQGEIISFEVELPYGKNQKQWFEVRLAPILNKQNEIHEIFINPINITERKKSQGEILQALEKERELNIIRTQFIATASHEFRTPLSNILSNTQLIDRYGDGWDRDRKEKTYKRIYDSIQDITKMLNDISLLGREKSGQLKFHPTQFNLYEFTEHIIQEVKATHRKFIEIDCNLDATIKDIFADKNLLRQILINVLGNALKYAVRNPLILFTVSKNRNNIDFRIIDNGIGIPEKDLDSIIEPFQRGSNTEKFQGSGLGLSIVRTCVELHNGNYSITSKENKGTTFWFSIPQ